MLCVEHAPLVPLQQKKDLVSVRRIGIAVLAGPCIRLYSSPLLHYTSSTPDRRWHSSTEQVVRIVSFALVTTKQNRAYI